jgi:VanZ family protein
LRKVLLSKKIINISILVVWLAIIFFMSSQAATESSGLSGVFVEPIKPYAPGFTEGILTTLVRKSAHIFMYFVLGILIYNMLRCYKLGTKKLVGYSILFAGLYAVTDEIHQSFVPGRSAELRDVLIDTIGAALGVALIWYVLKLNNRRKQTSATE